LSLPSSIDRSNIWVFALPLPLFVAAVMSATASQQAAARSVRRGCSDFLTKPLSRAILLKTVQTILENVLSKVRPRFAAVVVVPVLLIFLHSL
jgi:hypothetical protein